MGQSWDSSFLKVIPPYCKTHIFTWVNGEEISCPITAQLCGVHKLNICDWLTKQRSAFVSSYKKYSLDPERQSGICCPLLSHICVQVCLCLSHLITIKPSAWMQPKSLMRAPVNFMKISVQMENNCPAEGRPSKFMPCQTLGKPHGGASRVIGYISSVELKNLPVGNVWLSDCQQTPKINWLCSSSCSTYFPAVHRQKLFSVIPNYFYVQLFLLAEAGIAFCAGIRAQVPSEFFKSAVNCSEYLQGYLFVSSTLDEERERLTTAQSPSKTLALRSGVSRSPLLLPMARASYFLDSN